jgi:hypothetical protein
MNWNANYGEIPKPPLTQKWGNNIHTTSFALLGLCDMTHSTFEWFYAWCINPCLNDMPNLNNHFLFIQKTCS